MSIFRYKDMKQIDYIDYIKLLLLAICHHQLYVTIYMIIEFM